jgi:hypothetical protein
MHSLLRTCFTVCLVISSQPLLAIDISHGKLLQQQNCMSCHDDGMYTRENPRVTTHDALHSQVQRCETTLDLTWFPEDVDAVTDYLNQTYYKFK